jgi:hypothetical protein
MVPPAEIRASETAASHAEGRVTATAAISRPNRPDRPDPSNAM